MSSVNPHSQSRMINMVEQVEGQTPLEKISERYIHSLPPEQQAARLELILEASRGLHATLELDRLLQSTLDVARQLTGARSGALVLLDKESGELYLEAVAGNIQPLVARHVWLPPEGSLAGWIVQHDELLVVDDSQANAHVFHEVSELMNGASQTILAAPLKLEGQTIGVLELFNKQAPAGGFGPDDIYMVTALATHAAVAIENARRFQQRDALECLMQTLAEPAAAIMGFSRLILAEAAVDPAQVRTGVRRINLEAQRLGQMIDEFLDLSRLESGRLDLKKEIIDLPALAQEVINALKPEADHKEMSLSLAIDGPIPLIEADGQRLRQALIKLVEQALQDNWQNDQVEVRLFCNTVRVQVSIGGFRQSPGPEELSRLFDRFDQPAGQASSGWGGLSLRLAKKIIEAHGGDIWVESEAEGGSRFAFSLPVA